MLRLRLRPFVAGAGVVGLGLGVGTGCGLEPGSGDCRVTELEVEPITVTDPLAPLALTATLTADGEPVAGAEVDFSTIVEGAPNMPEGETGGGHVGTATTNADGVAEYVREEGIDGLFLPGESFVGYRADFTPLTPVDDERYCRVRNEATVG